MAVSDQEVAAWLAANPTATDAQIAQAAASAGVSAEQIARVTDIPVSEVVSRIEAASDRPAPQPSAPQQQGGVTEPGYKSSDYHLANVLKSNEPQAFKDLYSALQSGQARVGAIQNNTNYYDFAPSSETTYTVFDANGKPIPGVSVDPSSGRITLPSAGGFIYLNTPIGQGGTLAPITDYQSQVVYQGGSNSFTDFVREIAPIVLMAATGGGGGAWLGNLLAPTANLATQAAIGGAVLGGGGAALTGNDALTGALLGGIGGYYSGGGFNPADQGLNSQLTMAQIESGLGTPGYGYGAQAAASGLFDPALIGAGAYTQTSYPYDMAEFLAADAQNLYSQVGSNIPAIEQNLIASGVDPLVAADVANTITLNPNISTYDLTNYINTSFGGGNLYDVNAAAQYPTSVLPDAGGLLSDLPTTVTTPPKGTVVNPPTTTTPTPGTKVVDPDLAKGIISGVTKVLPGLLTAGALKQVTNKPSVGGLPTQGVPTNSPEYYQAIQQYYNTYMPEQPRDVATPLQQWYDSKYGA